MTTLGFFAGRSKRIDSRSIPGLNALVMEFSLPAALFVATASTVSDHYRHSKCALNCQTTAYSCNPSKGDIANVSAWSVRAGRNFQILKE